MYPGKCTFITIKIDVINEQGFYESLHMVRNVILQFLFALQPQPQGH